MVEIKKEFERTFYLKKSIFDKDPVYISDCPECETFIKLLDSNSFYSLEAVQRSLITYSFTVTVYTLVDSGRYQLQDGPYRIEKFEEHKFSLDEIKASWWLSKSTVKSQAKELLSKYYKDHSCVCSIDKITPNHVKASIYKVFVKKVMS